MFTNLEADQKVIIQLKNQGKSFKISVISACHHVVPFTNKYYFLVTLNTFKDTEQLRNRIPSGFNIILFTQAKLKIIL
ncbi:MAG: hypothetical protein A2315_03455 [Ignavibacteria bacterium RIFOXYB2_FULL_35_12]|nr:MAG: hypothetical protein A2058_10730 [Ignavibacteria bacterium GWA2_36_19]OGU52449.1 MAG: hypothetical protein A2006_12930 [Ignavibacteria bacterium GWC2_35_8]OGU63053.1 MAG: hypothetical protein A2X60_01115 [Ignavibacteria bacterium GWF2_35_20]OGU78624.1 MAG: hypothetical protein A2254_14600 [Ignavibacteria bacterium RIFOXYA2_FULL_35_9]OGU83052.1 MAG: hypothetical protein A2W11_04755 [Ignavibacteria bacterium RBG_16_35_7]OGU87036.1 MAG: hypothetical protein A2492_14205 [Ignavibacteria bac